LWFQRGTLRLAHGAGMDWLQLGRGERKMVIVPGAGDGLWTVRQSALHLAWRYRRRFWSHQLLILGRREPIPTGFGVQDYADDCLTAIDRLNWGPSIWECISAGGPIGQAVAQQRPDMVSGLVLASTTYRVDERLRLVLEHWRGLVHARRWADLYWNIAALNRRPEMVARFRSLKPLLHMAPPPRNPQRFIRLLDGLLRLDNYALLSEIACPTLVIGGTEDRIISADLQREMAQLIPHSRLVLFDGYGHAAPLEHPRSERVTRQFMEAIHR
jgi:pimeloyl-ACP methyl ester carboxylesterase